jgi:hypothetical protein
MLKNDTYLLLFVTILFRGMPGLGNIVTDSCSVGS